MGDGKPRFSETSVGSARRSLSLGGGVAASGGRCSGPGIGGNATAGDAPPAPTFAAFGPIAGAATGPAKSWFASRSISTPIAAARSRSALSLVLMVAAHIDVAQNAERVLGQDGGGAIERHQVGRGAALVDSH